MADICADISKLSSDIKSMLKEQSRTKLNQTAALDKGKITDTKTSVGEYRRTPKGKAVIYTGNPADPTLEPDARDVTEMIEHERPFICRAVMSFARPQAVCYTPGDRLYQFIKDDVEHTKELTESFRATVTSLWGEYKPSRLSDAEKAFAKELKKRELELEDILDKMAPEVIETCRVKL